MEKMEEIRVGEGKGKAHQRTHPESQEIPGVSQNLPLNSMFFL
jgi:hypothetical protein